jgi:uncharacterized protein YacL (UPF0231 family)
MEVPQDYNKNDSFYQNKLLQYMGINNSQSLVTNDDSVSYKNFPKNKSTAFIDQAMEEEMNYYDNSKINEEDLEESIEVTNEKSISGSSQIFKHSYFGKNISNHKRQNT